MVQLKWNIPSISLGSLMDHECCIECEFWDESPKDKGTHIECILLVGSTK